jgi:hypothetical protein
LRNWEIDRLYDRLSEEGKETADYIHATGKELDELSEEEERAAFARGVARLESLSIEDRALVTEVSRLKARMYYARAEEYTA